MTIRVKWLKNHGCVVARRRRYGKAVTRFVRPNGTLSMAEATAALGVRDMQLYRLEARGQLKMRVMEGERRLPLSEVKRLKQDLRALYPGHRRAG